MRCRLPGALVVLLALTSMAAADGRPAKAASAAEQVSEIAKEFNLEGFALRQSKTDEEREQVVTRVEKLTRRLLELAEANPKEPAAMDALVQAVIHEIWMENNTPHQVRDQDNPEVKAIGILLRDLGRERSSRRGLPAIVLWLQQGLREVLARSFAKQPASY